MFTRRTNSVTPKSAHQIQTECDDLFELCELGGTEVAVFTNIFK